MPSGQFHEKITLATMPLTFVYAAQIYAFGGQDLETCLLAGVITSCAHCFSGIWLSPDLDCHSRPYRLWGPLRFIWRPYQWLVNHRARISHSYVLSGLIRAWYLVTLALPFLWWVGRRWELPPLQLVLAGLLGITTGNDLHVFCDHLGSWWKRRFR